MNQQYVETVRLLLAVAPAVFRSPRFALKGGTAINLFAQDMPRLSVDIDVTFTDHTLNREDALRAIAADLQAAKSAISTLGFRAHLPTAKGGENVKLLVEGNGRDRPTRRRQSGRAGKAVKRELAAAKGIENRRAPLSRPAFQGAGYSGRHPLNIRVNVALPNANHPPAQLIELAPHAAIASYVRLDLTNPVSAVVARCQPRDPIREISAMPEVAIGEDRYSLATENEIWATGKFCAISGETQP